MEPGRHLFALLLASVVALLAIPAAAEPVAELAEHEEQAHHHSLLVGLKAAAGGQFADGEHHFGRGIGVFAEKPVIPGWLDLEVVVIAAEVGDEQIYPVDLLAKIPFRFHESLSGYLGAGASLTMEVDHGDNALRPGLAAAAGVYIWLDSRWGFDAELDYNYLLDDGGLHELNVAVGPILRF